VLFCLADRLRACEQVGVIDLGTTSRQA